MLQPDDRTSETVISFGVTMELRPHALIRTLVAGSATPQPNWLSALALLGLIHRSGTEPSAPGSIGSSVMKLLTPDDIFVPQRSQVLLNSSATT